MRRGTPSLSRYFAAVLCLALATAVTVAVGGWLGVLEERSALLRDSRFQFSLNSVKSGLESGLQLGLALPDLPGAQAQLEQARVHEPGILSIDVFDGDGRILFTTDQAGIGAHLPAAWRAPCLASGTAWRGRDDDGSLQCLALRNGYEQVVGGVLLRYRPADRAGAFGALSQRWPTALALLAALIALAVGGAWLLLRPFERRLATLAAGLENGHPMPDDRAPGGLVGPLPAALAALERHTEKLRAAECEADRIDHLDLH